MLGYWLTNTFNYWNSGVNAIKQIYVVWNRIGQHKHQN